MRQNFRDIKVIRGAKILITSDHRLLIAETLSLKTKKKGERARKAERKSREAGSDTIRSKWDNRRYERGGEVV
jgi:hypothetical protein